MADKDDKGRNENVDVDVNIMMVPWDKNSKPTFHSYSHTFHKRAPNPQTDWGFPQLIKRIKFIDPENDYIENDAALVLIKLGVEGPELCWKVITFLTFSNHDFIANQFSRLSHYLERKTEQNYYNSTERLIHKMLINYYFKTYLL